MTEEGTVERTLSAAALELRRAGERFALVGGLAVSVRAEVRFTRDVDRDQDLAAKLAVLLRL